MCVCVCVCVGVTHFCLALMTRTTAMTTRTMKMASRSSKKGPVAEPITDDRDRAEGRAEDGVGVWVGVWVGVCCVDTEEQRAEKGTQVRWLSMQYSTSLGPYLCSCFY